MLFKGFRVLFIAVYCRGLYAWQHVTNLDKSFAICNTDTRLAWSGPAETDFASVFWFIILLLNVTRNGLETCDNCPFPNSCGSTWQKHLTFEVPFNSSWLYSIILTGVVYTGLTLASTGRSRFTSCYWRQLFCQGMITISRCRDTLIVLYYAYNRWYSLPGLCTVHILAQISGVSNWGQHVISPP